MKKWIRSNEIELFEKIENSASNIEISCTSDEFNDFVYLVKIKKEDHAVLMINEFEKKIVSLLESNHSQIVNELNTKLNELENKYNEELKNINEQINEKFANIKFPTTEIVDYSPYFKDFSRKIDIISKKLFKMENEMNINKVTLKKISSLPEIKKELKFQQKLAKTIAKTTLN